MRLCILIVVFVMLMGSCAHAGAVTQDELQTVQIAGYEARRIAGFQVYVAAGLADRRNDLQAKALAALQHDLEEVADALPSAALDKVRSTKIFVEVESEARESGFSGRGAVYHVSEKWLVANGFIPEKTASIEIANVRDYLGWREHQPSMILHEFAHAYYWKVGPDIPCLRETYAHAVEAKKYEQVRYVLAKEEGDLRRAYALNNEQEYFAELSEAYFGRNDYFPFVNEDLLEFDPDGHDMIQRVWGIREEAVKKNAPHP